MAPKLIICGTGRAGTTLLVNILTAAGIDTGFTNRDLTNAENNIGRAGLERIVDKSTVTTLPRVLKSPHLVDVLPQLLSEKWFEIGLAIIPIRSLDEVAQSRINVHEKAISSSMDPQHAPGGLWKTDAPENQSWVLAEQFYRTVQPLVAFDIPVLFVSFPRFALDLEYFDNSVAAALEQRFDWDRDALNEAHISQCNPDLISGNDGKTDSL